LTSGDKNFNDFPENQLTKVVSYNLYMTILVRVYSCKLYVIGILSHKCSDNDLCHHPRSHRCRQRLLSVDFANLCRQPTRTSMLTQHVHWWHRSSMSTVLLT